MKRLFSSILSLGLIVALVSCSNSKADTSNSSTIEKGNESAKQTNQLSYNEGEVEQGLPTTTVKWDRLIEDFGTVDQGEVLETKFTLTNTGSEPLIINNATSTCGCTVPTVEKNKPIQPGESTEIGVRFDTKGKKGKNNKPINVFANVEGGKTTANIVATVNAPDKVETPAEK